jgi:hypothetical protein
MLAGMVPVSFTGIGLTERPPAEHKHKNKPPGESMKPFDVTIAFRKNLGRHGGPPKWEQRERVERVFAPDSAEAARIAQARTGARVVDCVCLWGN